jgi:hypothetical protein
VCPRLKNYNFFCTKLKGGKMMVNRTRFYLATALMILCSFVAVAMAQTSAGLTTPDMPDKMKTAIEASLQDPDHAAKTLEVIKPGEEPGFLGIPGAPDPSLILGLLWGIWVGWIFSTVGAFRRYHGRGGPYHDFRPGGLRQRLWQR